MPSEFQFDVFLSHSAKDKAGVRAVAERLRKDELKVWFDEWELLVAASRQSAGSALQPSAFSLQPLLRAFGSDPGAPGLEAGTFRFRDPLNRERRFIRLLAEPSAPRS